MTRYSLLARAAVVLLAMSCAGPVALARTAGVKPAAEQPKDVFAQLKFRNLGPAIAGGRVTAVTGVPGNPQIYYVGAAAGGVFETTDGGLNWNPVFNHASTSSIGAIAVAASTRPCVGRHG